MERPVSSVYLLDEIVLAGDWDGRITAWDIEGDHLWSIDVGNRVGRLMRLRRGSIGCTAGLDVAEISLDGDLLWSTELEGTSDHLVEYHDDTLCATSAVWDIEHGDFMEGAVWCLDSEGEVLHVERFDERPWDILSSGSILYLALAHPRSGLLHGDTAGLSHLQLSEYPSTALLLDGETLHVGTSRGEIWSVNVESLQSIKVEKPSYQDEDGVKLILKHQKNLIVVTEKSLTILETNGQIGWRWSAPRIIESVCVDFQLGSKPHVVVNHGKGAEAEVTFLDADVGEVVVQISAGSTIHTLYSTSKFLILGLESGEVFILQGDLLSRRLAKESLSPEAEVKSIEERSSMMARLRALRKDD